MSVEDAVGQALAHNETVGTAEQSARRARAAVREVAAAGLPQVQVDAQVLRQRVTSAAFPGPDGTVQSVTIVPSHAEVVSGTASQVLDIFGQVRRARGIADIGARIQALNVARSRSEVTYQARTAYYGVLQAHGAVDVAQAAVADAEEQLRLARAHVEAGTAPPFDVTRAEVQRADRQQTLISARNAEALAGAALNNILGRAVETPVRLAFISAAPDRSVDIAGQTEQALAARPESVQADLAVEAQRRNVGLRRLGNAPAVALTGTVSHAFTVGGFAANKDNYAVGVALAWPVWDSGATRARVEQAEADQRTAELQRDQLRRGITLEVRQAGLNVQDTADRFVVADKAVGQAEEALRLARVRYENGMSTQLEVLDAETALTQARYARNNARYQHFAARAAYDRALLGGLGNGAANGMNAASGSMGNADLGTGAVSPVVGTM